MNMSMDKPIALNSTPNEKRRNEVKKEVPKEWECKYEHVHGQTDGAESH